MVGSAQSPEWVEIPEVEAAITSQDFPATPAELERCLAERNVESRIGAVIGRLPDRRYESPAELIDAVRQLDPEERAPEPRSVAPGAPGSAAATGEIPQH
ncbi:MAG TPA: DUF2795 domain-containing protein [Candidatus Limnocylindrales bacterium]|jgi:hypothetical protein|nr:DUF2795 domain-containing protein [Candidatus Limnocylindrales bacterium]